jgi:hypothetical protein
MIVRLAKPDDIHAVIAMGERMLLRGSFAHTKLSFRACMNRMLLAIRNQHEWLGVALVGEKIVGALLLTVVKYWWSDSERYVLDDGLYAEHPGAGAALVRAGTRWAQSIGVKEIILTLNSNIETDRSVRVLNRCGFVDRGICVSMDLRMEAQRNAA